MTTNEFLHFSEIKHGYKPDILTCLANLSNDEVFTPPNLANDVLGILPQELFESMETKFLDPVCKSGVFLREIARRLMKGLETVIANEEERRKHIFTRQLFGMAITELTAQMSRRSVYCSKETSGKYSVVKFANNNGNIRYKPILHTFKNGNCIFCGASEKEYGAKVRNNLESHAYEFIHMTEKQCKEMLDMKFDVIIGNPPYQLGDGGFGVSAKPIYNRFVEQAKKLNPRFLSMIIPSRWYTGGKGLEEFRENMLNDKRIRTIADFENVKEVFPGIDLAGGVCYFLWDRDNKGDCNFINIVGDKKVERARQLNEFSVLVRQNQAIDIVQKIQKSHRGRYLCDVVSSRKPFGLPTNYEPRGGGIPCWFIQRIGQKYADGADVIDSGEYLNKWKLLVPKAPIAGQTDFSKQVGFYYDGNTIIARPGECCTESFIVAGAFNSEEEVLSYKSYIFTKIARFLLLQTVVSQDVTKKNFTFVPDLSNYVGVYTDEILRKQWDINDYEWEFIDSKISDISKNAKKTVDNGDSNE